MNNMKLIRALRDIGHVRCKYWSTCGREECNHYEPHYPSKLECIYNSPVKYCMKAEGFVYCVPYVSGAYANDECDPNLAFKAKRDAERRDGLASFDSNVEFTTVSNGKYITTSDGMVDVTAMGDDDA